MKKRRITLSEHQEILYDLIYKFDDFCMEHKLQYFLNGGTLLGAIRHNGIIPWDDDIDVMMPRSEYDKLIKLMHRDCPLNYRLYDIDNTRGYYYPFAKFGRKDTLLIEDDWHCVPSKGIAVNMDIFPIDGCPDNIDDAQNFAVDIFNNNKSKLRYWFDNHGIKSLSFTCRIKLMFRHIPFVMRHYFKKEFEKGTIYNYDDSKLVAMSAWGWYGKKEVIEKSNFTDTIYVQFGNRKLPVPVGYDVYLSNVYGDYMTPPPINERISTHAHENLFIFE